MNSPETDPRTNQFYQDASLDPAQNGYVHVIDVFRVICNRGGVDRLFIFLREVVCALAAPSMDFDFQQEDIVATTERLNLLNHLLNHNNNNFA